MQLPTDLIHREPLLGGATKKNGRNHEIYVRGYPFIELTQFTNLRMLLFHIPQCSIQNRNVHISVLNGAFWDLEQVHSWICETALLLNSIMMSQLITCWILFNTLRLRRNGCHFADNLFKCIFLNENVWIPIKISLKFAPKGPINNFTALVRIMAWGCPGDKPLFEPMTVSLPTHICFTQPQWVKKHLYLRFLSLLDTETCPVWVFLFCVVFLWWLTLTSLQKNCCVTKSWTSTNFHHQRIWWTRFLSRCVERPNDSWC